MKKIGFKKCSKCGEIKDIISFRNRCGLRKKEKRSQCRKCENNDLKIWRKNNIQRIKKYKKQEWIKEYNREYAKKYMKSHKKERAFLQRRRTVKKIGNGGYHTLQEWEDKKKEYNYRCIYCGIHENILHKKYKYKIWWKLTEDHVMPLSKGGTDYIYNIVPACISCNTSKNNKII